ncbi:MAG: flagellar biosynthesis anti-sigma factor FlgM [Dissulfurispiraceae bacterium]
MIITDKVDISGSGIQPPDRTKGQGTGEQAGGVAPQDKVLVSDQAKEIGRLQAEVSKLPDIRPDVVNEVKNAINNGTYNVKGEAVAGKVLKEALIDSVI